MPWHARLQLDYRLDGNRTVLHHQHDGPLRILKSLYPEGDGICHNVVVHPPGGLVGGDTLDIALHLAQGTHALLGTPGATRFYATDTDRAAQQVSVTLEPGARLEWLPLEAIAYPGCKARNGFSATLAEGAEMMGWDVTALGLPASPTPPAFSNSGWSCPASGSSRPDWTPATRACWSPPWAWAASAAWAPSGWPAECRCRASGANACWRP